MGRTFKHPITQLIIIAALGISVGATAATKHGSADEETVSKNSKSKASDRCETEIPNVAFDSDAMRAKGYYRYSELHYGTASTIKRIEKAGLVLKNSGIYMGVGDISADGGGNEGRHSSHKKGLDADFRLIMHDGVAAQGTVGSSGYDRQKTFEMLKAIVDADPKNITTILNNDPKLRKMISDYIVKTYKRNDVNVSYWDGHDNHVHISWEK